MSFGLLRYRMTAHLRIWHIKQSKSFFSRFLASLGLFLLGFALLHDLRMLFLERMRNGLRQIKNKDVLVLLELGHQLLRNRIRNPVIVEIVLGDGLVVFEYWEQLFLDFLLQTFPQLLLVCQQIYLRICHIQLLQLIPAIVNSSQDLIRPLIF